MTDILQRPKKVQNLREKELIYHKNPNERSKTQSLRNTKHSNPESSLSRSNRVSLSNHRRYERRK